MLAENVFAVVAFVLFGFDYLVEGVFSILGCFGLQEVYLFVQLLPVLQVLRRDAGVFLFDCLSAGLG